MHENLLAAVFCPGPAGEWGSWLLLSQNLTPLLAFQRRASALLALLQKPSDS